MPSFTQGVQAGSEVSNPFGVLLREIGKAGQRRMDEDMKRKEEERQLKRALEVLGEEHEFKKKEKQFESDLAIREKGVPLQQAMGQLGLASFNNKPIIKNEDGSISTEQTIGINIDGKEITIPTIVNGKKVSNEEAIQLFMKGKNNSVGTSSSIQEGNQLAENRSNQIGQSMLQSFGLQPQGTVSKTSTGEEFFRPDSLEDTENRLQIQKLQQELNPEFQEEKSRREGEGKAIEKSFESSEKLSQAVRRLSVINKQFKEALPSGDKTPVEQRISAWADVIGAKTGIKPNPKLLAIKQNVRPMAINLIRLFGEVGNLSQSEQQGAIDVIELEGRTDEERVASVRQFAEFALSGAPPDAINYILQQADVKEIIDSLGIELPQLQAGGADGEGIKSTKSGNTFKVLSK